MKAQNAKKGNNELEHLSKENTRLKQVLKSQKVWHSRRGWKPIEIMTAKEIREKGESLTAEELMGELRRLLSSRDVGN